MKLILAIINRDDTGKLMEALVKKGFRATIISSTGGFLREGNSTLIIGADEDKVEEILEIIRENCHARKELVKFWPPTPEVPGLFAPPLEVEVGGATVFILNVERLIQI